MGENIEILGEEQLQGIKEFELLKAKYRAGGVKKLTGTEREILEFCYGRDMVQFIREEFRKNPILYDEYGNIIDNPKYSLGSCPDSFFDGAPVNMVNDDGRNVL